MKTKLILGSFLALSLFANSQAIWNGSGTSGNAYRSGAIGINNSSPSTALDIIAAGPGDGIKVTQGSYGSSALHLNNTTSGGKQWSFYSLGYGDTWVGSGGLAIASNPSYPDVVIDQTGNVGIGTTNPSNKLHVETSVASDGIYVNQNTTGSSGLHINNTTSGGQHWSLFSTGNGSSQGSGNFSIFDNTNGVDRFFIDGSTGNIGIGHLAPTAALHVIGSQSVIKGDANGNFPTGVEGNGTGTSATSGFAYGFRGVSTGGYGNVGGSFLATGNNSSSRSAMGVFAGVTSVGLGSTNYGIYATVNGLHLGGNGPDYAGYFDGDVVTTSASFYPSDKRIKKNIEKVSNSLTLINKLNPVTYNFDTEANPSITLPTVKQYGFISQEIQELIPEFTRTIIHPAKLDDKGNELYPKKEILGLNYNGFIALLTKGIQEQQTQIADQSQANNDLRAQLIDQQKQLDDQKQLINDLSQKMSGTTGINSVTGVETGFQMSQNEPNPFTHETVVKYTLPQTISNAFMAVYDLTGKQITTFPIDQKGSSSITITSEKLAAGIYIYSIVADGKVMDSKRMIVADK